MATLSVALLGLNRLSVSIGLSLKRYMKKGGKHQFKITGYDFSAENEKKAKKMGAIDQIEHNMTKAIVDADLVVMNLSYEEVEKSYRTIVHDLRAGVVILDMSPLKIPSLAWAEKYLTDDHYLVGFTPIVNPRYIFRLQQDIEEAEEDMFDDSAILLTPAAACAKEAVDLAFNFASLLGSKPRFLDPTEHDTLLAHTVQLPRLLGILLFYDLMQRENWGDLKWFTNPDFGVLTRPLFDTHPDALRDEFINNRDAVTRGLDSLINLLQQYRDALQSGEDHIVETVIVEAAKEYEVWINNRYRADWDAEARVADPKAGTSLMHGLLGGTIADKLLGRDDDDD
jgi:prephenate dehydrogenase